MNMRTKCHPQPPTTPVGPHHTGSMALLRLDWIGLLTVSCVRKNEQNGRPLYVIVFLQSEQSHNNRTDFTLCSMDLRGGE